MKNKVIHTRLSEELFEKIAKRAKKQHTNVSNLMRGVVEDFFEISEDVADIATDKIRKKYFNNKDKKDDKVLIGYQLMTLTIEAECYITSQKIPKNTDAYLAFFEGENDGKIVCQEYIENQTK